MRRYIRALVLCMVFAVFSGLFVYSKLFYSDVSVASGAKRLVSPPQDPGAGGEEEDGAATGAEQRNPHRANRNVTRDGRDAVGSTESRLPPPMHLAVVTCGERLEETLTMIKSGVLFSIKPLHLHIFAEDQLHASFVEALESWPGFVRSTFTYTLHPISFPSENAKEWKKLFKPCASQRLFLPLILKDVDSVVYVDSDILFLRPVDELWGFLSRFDRSQLAAMAPEHEEPRIAWYNRFAMHPFYGRTGVNSGVMLMNMTRMRSAYFKVKPKRRLLVGCRPGKVTGGWFVCLQNDMTPVGLLWEELLMPLLQKYKLEIPICPR